MSTTQLLPRNPSRRLVVSLGLFWAGCAALVVLSAFTPVVAGGLGALTFLAGIVFFGTVLGMGSDRRSAVTINDLLRPSWLLRAVVSTGWPARPVTWVLCGVLALDLVLFFAAAGGLVPGLAVG